MHEQKYQDEPVMFYIHQKPLIRNGWVNFFLPNNHPELLLLTCLTFSTSDSRASSLERAFSTSNYTMNTSDCHALNKTTSRQNNWTELQCNTHHNTHTHPFNGPLSGTTQVSQYQKGKTNLDFTEARDSEWQWNPLGHMQLCTSLQTDNHARTPPLSFLQAGCPSCRPTNSVKALKANSPQQCSGFI